MESKQILNEQLSHHIQTPRTPEQVDKELYSMMNTYDTVSLDGLPKKDQEQSTSNDSQKGFLESAREMIHEKVATDEQLYAEKSLTEKIKENIPTDSKEVVDILGSAFYPKQDTTSKEDTNEMDIAPSVIPHSFKSEVRNKIYEATKPPSEKSQ